MRLKEFFRDYIGQLKTVYEEQEATAIAGLCFEATAGISRTELIRNPEMELSEEIILTLKQQLALLLRHHPVQYVLAEAWFHGLKFRVTESVLIPRPETEELVTLVVEYLKKGNSQQRIIDIGTGSGCIAISIKHDCTDAQVTAVDVEEKALEVARNNANKLATKINFIQADILDKSQWSSLPVFDVIVSNPPYIPLSEKKELDSNVSLHEPGSALFVPDENPLIFYEAITLFAKEHLTEAGLLAFEVHENLANETKNLIVSLGFEAEIIKDMYGKQRMISATRCR